MGAKKAYVFIDCLPGEAARVARQVRRNPAVRVVDMVTGPWDMIAVLEADSAETLARNVLVEIAAIEGVKKTLTSGVVTDDFIGLAEAVSTLDEVLLR